MKYKILGLIGGIGPESTVDYYKTIIQKFRQRAGMNDYVSKPIRKESFLKTVKKWTNIENEELN